MTKTQFNFLDSSSVVNRDEFRIFLQRSEVKLNIGSGDDMREGWINIDAVGYPDVVVDVTNLSMFPDECADVIENNHVIEHISYKETLKVLQEWIRILKVGGEFVLRCPDVGKMCLRYAQQQWQIGPDGTERNIINVLYGNFEDPHYGVHRAGFDKNLIRHYLQQFGLVELQVTDSDRGHDFELLARGFRGAIE